MQRVEGSGQEAKVENRESRIEIPKSGRWRMCRSGKGDACGVRRAACGVGTRDRCPDFPPCLRSRVRWHVTAIEENREEEDATEISYPESPPMTMLRLLAVDMQYFDGYKIVVAAIGGGGMKDYSNTIPSTAGWAFTCQKRYGIAFAAAAAVSAP